MRVAGIQPGYLPWLGYFDQMRRVDRFLIADELPFSASGWTHRNRVLGPNGPFWLRLPARPERGQRICDVRLDRSVPWRTKHLRALRQSYAHSPHAGEELDRLEPLLDQQAEYLVAVVVPVLRHLVDRLEIATPLVVSSELGLEAGLEGLGLVAPSPTGRIIGYLRQLGADSLLEGAAGEAFLDVGACREAGIAVAFHDYVHPVYPQASEPFTSHLSVMDLLLERGATEAAAVLRAVGEGRHVG